MSVDGFAPPPLSQYSRARLRELHAYWMSIERAAKNPAQRERADRNLVAIATELRARAESQS